MAFINGALILSADDGVHGREPWSVYEGDSVVQIADLWPGPLGSDPTAAVEYAHDPVFVADAGDGRRIWRATRGSAPGAEEGWLPPADMFQGSLDDASDPRDVYVLQDVDRMPVILWFTALGSDGRRQAHTYRPAHDVRNDEVPGSLAVLPAHRSDDASWWLTPSGKRLFFAAQDVQGGPGLWVTEGTRPSTYLVQPTDEMPLSGIATLDGFVAAGSQGKAGSGQLWVGDGTVFGMYIQGAEDRWRPGGPSELTSLDRWVAFVADRVPASWESANDGVGRELWATGPWPMWPRGTRMVRDIRPGVAGSEPRDLTWLRATSELH
jgi:ELWxxDGT repeat protein